MLSLANVLVACAGDAGSAVQDGSPGADSATHETGTPPSEDGAVDAGSSDGAPLAPAVARCGAPVLIQDPIVTQPSSQTPASDRSHLFAYRNGAATIAIWDRDTDASVTLPGENILGLESHGASSWLFHRAFAAPDQGDVRWAGADGVFATADDTVTSIASIAVAGGLANYYTARSSHQFLYIMQATGGITTYVCSLDGTGGVATCGQGLTPLASQGFFAPLDGVVPQGVDLEPTAGGYHMRLIAPNQAPSLIRFVPDVPDLLLMPARGPLVRIHSSLGPPPGMRHIDLYDALDPSSAVLPLPATTIVQHGENPVASPRGAFTMMSSCEQLSVDAFQAVVYFLGAGNSQRVEIPGSRAPLGIVGDQLFYVEPDGAISRVTCTLE